MKFSLIAIVSISAFLSLTVSPIVFAVGRTEAGLTLLEPPSARAASLGQAFSSMKNDVTAFSYNPAALYPLESGQASFLYEQGLAEDSFGQMHVGYPREKDSFGLSLGYYDSGEFSVFDGVTQQTIQGQSDLSVGLGYARSIGSLTMGITGKYFSSQLAESESATATAFDIGVGMPGLSGSHWGFSLQNFGTSLKYNSSERNLPRIGRIGLNYPMFTGKIPTTFLLESAYHFNHEEMRPAVGLESNFGPMALRTGYKQGSELQEFTIGTGFAIGRTTFDYAFGLVEKLDTNHRVSFSLKFGTLRPHEKFVRKKPSGGLGKTATKKNDSKSASKETSEDEDYVMDSDHIPVRRLTGHERVFFRGVRRNKVYIIKEGDTLKSIAKRRMGYEEASDDILRANSHLGLDSENLKPGQSILLPEVSR